MSAVWGSRPSGVNSTRAKVSTPSRDNSYFQAHSHPALSCLAHNFLNL
eukprot:CAMPEP_0115871224 /NCGR_PEP_ID=MMETSP0287-20121206/22753_1 /TAXON_ID=412157 /ORGANISM="Chrysochromulina rotalis, Strain UIO044" /LENGTH=47 /DNA_ID= /DNA_START= /DNA_END= /DNA_ORIENTATION=